MPLIEPIAALVSNLAKLPGVGHKTAQRLAYYILSMTDDSVSQLSQSIIIAKRDTRPCVVCGNYSTVELCPVCADDSRDNTIVCVVKDPRDVAALERTRDYRGLYHVLYGAISPLEGIGPDDIRLRELIARLPGVGEVIIATNPDIEGEATAAYIARLIKPLGVKVTRIAHGMPVGGDLEYTDEVTISRAMQGRREL